jgi:hypothetical protein
MDEDDQILRLAARLLEQEIDYHGWQAVAERYGDLVRGLDELDVRNFIEKIQGRRS